MNALIDALFEIAGMTMLGHLALCVVLQWRLRSQENIVLELFAVPNSLLSKGIGPRLLRTRYYWPWTKFNLVESLEVRDQIILVAARVTGLFVPIALLAFLAMSILQAGISAGS